MVCSKSVMLYHLQGGYSRSSLDDIIPCDCCGKTAPVNFYLPSCSAHHSSGSRFSSTENVSYPSSRFSNKAVCHSDVNLARCAFSFVFL